MTPRRVLVTGPRAISRRWCSEAPPYAGERVNVDMTARVSEVAAATDVQRVVCTSTNQASKWYERPFKERLIDRVDPFDYPRPDSFSSSPPVDFG